MLPLLAFEQALQGDGQQGQQSIWGFLAVGLAMELPLHGSSVVHLQRRNDVVKIKPVGPRQDRFDCALLGNANVG